MTGAKRQISRAFLVPKLLFGNALRETPVSRNLMRFRRVRETEFREVRSQTGVWERGGTRAGKGMGGFFFLLSGAPHGEMCGFPTEDCHVPSPIRPLAHRGSLRPLT